MAPGFESLGRDRETAHFAFSGERSKIWHKGGFGQPGLYSANDARSFPEFTAPVTAEPLVWNAGGAGPSYDAHGNPQDAPEIWLPAPAKILVRTAPSGAKRGMKVVTEAYDHSFHLDDLDLLSRKLWGDLDAPRWGTLGGLWGFQQFFASAPLSLEAEVGPGDSVLAHLVFSTGYGFARKLRVTTVRPVCANTLKAGELRESASAWTSKHIGDSRQRLESAADSLRSASEVFDNFVTEARAMRRTELVAGSAAGSFGEFMARVSGAVDPSDLPADATDAQRLSNDKARANATALEIAVYRQPGYDGSGSVWQALNAVTWYADHGAAIDGKTRRGADGLSAALAGTWLDGPGAAMKDRALVEARKVLAVAGTVL